ncbi:MAG: cell division protein FtsA [Oscillospiraceae bacterium]|nr:cell division protein FtsA [Oscillospiraceae bacterium]
MAIGDIIVGIDIGTSKVATVVGEVNNFNQIEVIGISESKCKGIKKAQIINEDEIVNAIRKNIEEIEETSNIKINSAYTTIPGKYVTIVQNSITKETKDKYAGITLKDVTTSIIQVKDIEIPDDKVLIDIVPGQFILENGTILEDPIGKLSTNFRLDAQIILADREYVKRLTSIFKKLGIEIDGIVPITLVERSLVLDTHELSDTVMLLDIGAGNTDIGVFDGTNFIYTNTIPVGGDNITNDIAYVLQISFEEAEKLKKQYALALKSYISNDNEIMLNSIREDKQYKIIKSSELIEIIEARVEEIFSLVNKDISNIGLKSNINNVILTGQGIANINKSDVAGKIILNIPVKMSTSRLITTVKPGFRTAYSLIRYIAARPFAKTVSSNIDEKIENNILKSILDRVKEFFYS